VVGSGGHEWRSASVRINEPAQARRAAQIAEMQATMRVLELPGNYRSVNPVTHGKRLPSRRDGRRLQGVSTPSAGGD
jgi:hypothetical protein